MYISRIVTYYVNNKNRTFACVYIRAYTSSLRNIDNLVRLLRLAAIFSPSSVCMYVYIYICVCVKDERGREREKKGKIFVLLKELACMYRCGRKKSACVWSRSDNDNVTKLGIEKKRRRRRRKSLVLVAIGIGCMM